MGIQPIFRHTHISSCFYIPFIISHETSIKWPCKQCPENSNVWAHLQPQTFPVPQVQVNPPRKNVGKKNRHGIHHVKTWEIRVFPWISLICVPFIDDIMVIYRELIGIISAILVIKTREMIEIYSSLAIFSREKTMVIDPIKSPSWSVKSIIFRWFSWRMSGARRSTGRVARSWGSSPRPGSQGVAENSWMEMILINMDKIR